MTHTADDDIESTYKLSDEQQKVMDLALKGQSVLFTGCAGTGKSLLLRRLIQAMQEKHRGIQNALGITACTGIAAVNISGCTLHSFLGISPEGMWRAAWGRRKVLNELRTLIIDEISMLSADFFELVDFILTYIRNYDDFKNHFPEFNNAQETTNAYYTDEFHAKIANRFQPFGGVQLILCGDFLQLPPVKGLLCFDAVNWKRAVPNVVLTKTVFRQSNSEFITLLNDLRIGKVTPQHYDKLTKNVVGEKNGILPTQIFTRNSDVADLNDRYLRECEGEEFVFSTEDIYDFEDKLLRSRLTKDMDERIPQQLPLKVGAQVLLTKNLDVKRGLVNGSRGVVTGFRVLENAEFMDSWKERQYRKFKKKYIENVTLPMVRYMNGVEELLNYEIFEVHGPGEVTASRVAIPLKHAWALTVHKCQGMTLDSAVVSLTHIFCPGLAYVSLSRVRSHDNLQLRGYDRNRVGFVSPRAIQFYNGTLKPPPPKPPALKPSAPPKAPAERYTSHKTNNKPTSNRSDKNYTPYLNGKRKFEVIDLDEDDEDEAPRKITKTTTPKSTKKKQQPLASGQQTLSKFFSVKK